MIQPALQPPLPPALTAAPHVRDRVEVAAVEQAGHRQAELRPLAGLVGPVAVEQAGRGAVQRQARPVGDRHRDRRPVRGGRGDPLRPVAGRVVAGHLLPLAQPPPAAGQVHVVPGRRVDQRLGAHGHRGGVVLLVDPQRQRHLGPGGLDEPLLPRLPVDDAQLGRRVPPLLHHQEPAEHVARHQPRAGGAGDHLVPAVRPRRAARARRRAPDEPELGGPVVGDQVERAPVRAVGVIGPVLHPLPPLPQNDRCRAGVRGGDDERLGGVTAFGFQQDVRAAAGRPHDDVEALVLLGEHQHVLGGIGADVVPPDLVRPVGGVGHDVEHRARVRRPGQPVVGPPDPLRQPGRGRGVSAAGQVPDPQLVDLVAVEVDRVGEQGAVGADLAHAELHVPAAALRVLQQQVLVEQHLRGGALLRGRRARFSRRRVPLAHRVVGRAAAELLVLKPGHGPGEVIEVPAPPARRFGGGRHPGGHLPPSAPRGRPRRGPSAGRSRRVRRPGTPAGPGRPGPASTRRGSAPALSGRAGATGGELDMGRC